MKKTLTLLILIATFATDNSQAPNLDTVPVQSLTLSYLQWKWVKGKTESRSDSLAVDAVKKIDAVFDANPGKTNVTQLQVTNLHAKVIVGWYSLIEQGITVSEFRNGGNTISTVLNALTNTSVQFYFDAIDAEGLRKRDAAVRQGTY
jgi:hypothetical protein